MIPHSHIPARVRWVVALATAALLTLSVAVASASTAREEREGAALLREMEGGELRCDDASGEDFERIGEYVMGRALGSVESHEAMDEMMSRVMGPGSEPLAHEAMGRRYTGCGGGQLPSGFGRIMGAFNAMGMMGGGMMGGLGPGGGYGPPASMMGGYWNGSRTDDDFDGPSAAAAVGMMAVLIGAGAVAALLLGRRRSQRPLDTLRRRYAAGEMTNADYEERRRLLGGS